MLDHIVVIVIRILSLVFALLVLLLLAIDVVGDYLVQDDQAARFACLCATVKGSGREVDDLSHAFPLADDVVELLYLKHVLDDGASVEVVLVAQVRTKHVNELGYRKLLL